MLQLILYISNTFPDCHSWESGVIVKLLVLDIFLKQLLYSDFLVI